VPYRNIVYGPATRVLVSQSRQEHYLLAHVFKLPVILWTTAVHGHLFMLWEVVGTLGEVGLPEWFAIVWLALFVALAIGSEGPGVGRAARGWIAGMLAVYFLGTALALYLTWTALGAGEISGMHGRYFTLVLIFAVPMLAALAAGGLGILSARSPPQRSSSARYRPDDVLLRVLHYTAGSVAGGAEAHVGAVLMQVLGRPRDRRCKRPCSRPCSGAAPSRGTVSGVAAQPQTITPSELGAQVSALANGIAVQWAGHELRGGALIDPVDRPLKATTAMR